MMINQTPNRTPLPNSAWGPDTARILTRIDQSIAARDPRDDDDDAELFRKVLAMETYSESRFD